MKRYIKFFLFILLVVICLEGCSVKLKKPENKVNIDFTVVKNEEAPEELLTIIKEKEKQPFKLTFTTKGNEYLYIVVGYGEQKTGGYSIAVEDLYSSNNAIYINTTLIGPKKDEMVSQVLTYPYIIVKIEYVDKNVVFE